jgi:hypothetical protein
VGLTGVWLFFLQSIREAIRALSDFCLEDETMQKSRQKLLRHLRVVDNIIMMLKAPYQCPKGACL